MKIDGEFVVVEGNCPMCDWTHKHSHVRSVFHETVSEQKKFKGAVLTATKPPEHKPLALPPAKVNTPAATGTFPKKTETKTTSAARTNVYRIRTVGFGLNLDRTVLGRKKKLAIDTARTSHSKMFQGEKDEVALVFCRYIGNIKEPTTYSSQGFGWGYQQYGDYWD